MQLQDPDERAFYEELTLTDGLSVKRLSAAIQGDHYLSALDQPAGKPLKLPRPLRFRIFVPRIGGHRIAPPRVGVASGATSVDLRD